MAPGRLFGPIEDARLCLTFSCRPPTHRRSPQHSNWFTDCDPLFEISKISVADLWICTKPPSEPPVRVELPLLADHSLVRRTPDVLKYSSLDLSTHGAAYVHCAASHPLGLIFPVFQIIYPDNLAEPTTSFFNQVQTFPSSFLSRNTPRSSIQNSDSTGPNLCLCYVAILSNGICLCSRCLNRSNAKRKSIFPSRLLLLSFPPPTSFLATIATIITVRQCQLVLRDHCTYL